MISWLFGETSVPNSTESKSVETISEHEWIVVKPPTYEFHHCKDFIAVIRQSDHNIWLIQDTQVYHCHADEFSLQSLKDAVVYKIHPTWIAKANTLSGNSLYKFCYGENQSCPLELLNDSAGQYFINLYTTHCEHSCHDLPCNGKGHLCCESGCIEEYDWEDKNGEESQ
jgi:hypothetical protein